VIGHRDAHRVIGQLNAEDLGFGEDEYEALRDGLGVLALGSDDGYNHSVVVVTLFPEAMERRATGRMRRTDRQ
jgi:hypothetical protein